MDIFSEIQKITKYQNSLLPGHERKSETCVDAIVDRVQKDYNELNLDFTQFVDIEHKQSGKTRHVKMYAPFSSEEILCIYLKRLLDRKFHIKYPNRNEYTHSLFDILSALRDMNDYTIFRFDFHDFFNTVSSEYVFEKFISPCSMERFEEQLLSRFVRATKFAYAGLNTSNIICEIIAKQFDEALTLKFSKHGLIFYRRYIDDGVLIFNRFVDENDCKSVIASAIDEVFFDGSIPLVQKCRTQLNASKMQYLSAHDLAKNNKTGIFDFLGYQFEVKPNYDRRNKMSTTFLYGITKRKIDKYTEKINEIIQDYMKDHSVELLRHRLRAFTSRTVYQLTKYKTIIWKTKGFVSNYQELRYRTDNLDVATKDFLQNGVIRAFNNNGIYHLPYFLSCNPDESVYNLYNNMKRFKTLLFVEPIGIGMDTLTKMCQEIDVTGIKLKKYDGLVRDYLIKVKVGH